MGLLRLFGIKAKPKAPWEKYYKNGETKIDIPDATIYEYLKSTAETHMDAIALEYMGSTITYREFLRQIEICAKAFRSQGIRRGDIVTICMPNTPEGLISFYALNRIGAIANMIHPLSSEQEIKNYLISTKSVMLVMIDICYEKVAGVIKETDVYKTIIVSAGSSLKIWKKFGYLATKSYKIKKPFFKGEYMFWRDFMNRGVYYNGKLDFEFGKDDPAVILHSGGTTGNPKGIVLANSNFNAMSVQIGKLFTKLEVNDHILAIMPIFHGFGLSVSICTPLTFGCSIYLVPQFDARTFDKLIMRTKPAVLVGVPTLFEALINKDTRKLDLSCVKYVISGGDSLTPELAAKINTFLEEKHATAKVSQGYGMTESTAATALGLDDYNIPGSIGIPFPGNYFKICKPHTQEEVPVGETGEICVCGPTVMMGYLDNEKETNEVLQIHKDGNMWLHTGDMAYMREDGVIFYQSRLKRMIITSGYNVYPSQIENVIESHEAVLKCSVIGVPHPYKQEVAKAIIVLKNGYSESLAIKKEIKELCEKNLARYSLPHDYEFRKSLPKTLIGKVDLKKLQEEVKESGE